MYLVDVWDWLVWFGVFRSVARVGFGYAAYGSELFLCVVVLFGVYCLMFCVVCGCVSEWLMFLYVMCS